MALVVLAALLAPAAARAARPFDSTNASIVGPGVVEVELGPVGWLEEDGDDLLAAPDLCLNIGLPSDLEASLEMRGVTALDDGLDEQRYQIVDTAVAIKRILLRGSLQDGTGPSAVAELALRLPTLHGTTGWGVEGIAALSQAWPHAALHINATAAINRADNLELGTGLILEGPRRWELRPAVELTSGHERGEGESVSGLVGLAYEPRGNLAFDLGFRWAREGGAEVRELRLGVTWSFDR